VRWFEPRVPARLGADPKFPDAEFMLVDDLVAFDWSRETATATLIANVDPSRFADTTAAYRAAQESLDRLEQTLADRVADTGPLTGLAAGLTAPFAHDDTERASFEAGVAAVLEHLHAGDCMQTVLSRRVTLGYSGEPLDLYERLRQASPVAYHFMVRFAEAGHERRAYHSAMGMSRCGRLQAPVRGARPRPRTRRTKPSCVLIRRSWRST
jgi:anthranilate synthase component 1